MKVRASDTPRPIRVLGSTSHGGRRGTLLSARGVSRRYGRRVALAPTDLDIGSGELSRHRAERRGQVDAFGISPARWSRGSGRACRVSLWSAGAAAAGVRSPRHGNLELFAARGDRRPGGCGHRCRARRLPDDGRPASALSLGGQRLNPASRCRRPGRSSSRLPRPRSAPAKRLWGSRQARETRRRRGLRPEQEPSRRSRRRLRAGQPFRAPALPTRANARGDCPRTRRGLRTCGC